MLENENLKIILKVKCCGTFFKKVKEKHVFYISIYRLQKIYFELFKNNKFIVIMYQFIYVRNDPTELKSYNHYSI